MKKTPQWELADQMSAFLESSPIGEDLQCMKNREFLYHFEAERLLIMRDLLMAAGFEADRSFAMLDFGFLHGLSQEFLHRFFPGSSVTVCDRPGSPIFADASYLAAIKKRGYVSLVPCDISAVPPEGPKYDVIILGEIIEHLDPTTVAVALSKLRNRINPGGVLMVTTPNRAGLYNSYLTMRGADVQDAPIPHEIMGYGHIHLWSQAALSKTAAHAGWKFRDVRFLSWAGRGNVLGDQRKMGFPQGPGPAPGDEIYRRSSPRLERIFCDRLQPVKEGTDEGKPALTSRHRA